MNTEENTSCTISFVAYEKFKTPKKRKSLTYNSFHSHLFCFSPDGVYQNGCSSSKNRSESFRAQSFVINPHQKTNHR